MITVAILFFGGFELPWQLNLNPIQGLLKEIWSGFKLQWASIAVDRGPDPLHTERK